jgi:hypothetical protein
MEVASDPFDDLLGLEEDYYQEGYDAGVADSRYAGMIEGRVFGMEKGAEKTLELGKLQGRALVWRGRIGTSRTTVDPSSNRQTPDTARLREVFQSLQSLSNHSRLQKHVDGLLTVSDAQTISKNNSDEAVAEFDDRIARSKAKAKIIANIVGESSNPTSMTNAGIEDATGLDVRQ